MPGIGTNMGIDSIILKINEKADAECAALLSKAKAQAEAVLEQSRKASQAKTEQILQNAEKKAESIKRVAVTAAGMNVKKEKLKAKRLLIDQAFELAIQRLCDQDAESYEKTLLKLLAGCQITGNEVLHLAKNASDKLGKEIGSRLNQALSESGRPTVMIGDPTDECRGGFILASPNSRQICSFENLVNDCREELEAQIAEVLFGSDE